MSRQASRCGPQGRPADFVGILRYLLSPDVLRQAHKVAPRPKRSDTRWSLHPLLMILVFSCWAASDNPHERFGTARAFFVSHFHNKRRAPGKTLEGFCDALARLPCCVLRAFACALRHRLGWLLGPFWSVDGFIPLGCDGTRLACPRTEELERYLCHDPDSGAPPQVWVTAVVHLRLGVLWSWIVGKSDASEREHLHRLLPTLPAGSLVVTDAGYQGYEMMKALMGKAGVSALMRVSSQTLFYLIDNEDGTPAEPVDPATWSDGLVYWWTGAARTAGLPPLKVRLMRVSSSTGKSVVWMVSDVLSGEKLSLESASRFYRMRWESEGFFRTYKQAMKKVKLTSRSVKLVHREVEGSLLGVQVLLAMGAWAVASSPGMKAGEAVCSPAKVLSEIRHEMDGNPKKLKRPGRFLDRLRRAVRDQKPRKSPKVRRPWPKRKDHKPPKPPKLRKMSDKLKTLLENHLRRETHHER